MTYVLTPRLRKELKKPLQKVVSASQAFKEKFITVGDACLFQSLEKGRPPLLGIYDKKIKRKPAGEKINQKIREWEVPHIRLENPAGTISREAMHKIKEVLNPETQKKFPMKIQVKGEEDLLVIPCVLYAPHHTNVYYGQPGEGISLVQANPENKEKMRKILKEMKT